MKVKRNIKNVFWLFFIMFIILQAYLFKFLLIDSEKIVASPYNRRLSAFDESILRGSIYDSDRVILAFSEKDDFVYDRVYLKGKEIVHLLGNVINQKSGVEMNYNYLLQNLSSEVFQRMYGIMFSTELVADSVVLTIDSKLQQKVFETLGENNGAIVCMEPSTGKILASVSYPNYDPNNIVNSWSELSNDTENYPLLNRSTLGMYPPGSTFKILTSLMIMRNIEGYEDYVYNCTGEETFTDVKIKCYNNIAHGEVNLDKALTHSCNTYFAHMSQKLNNDEFKQLAESFLFNNTYGYPLEYNKSSFVLDSQSSLAETLQTSIGQGRTLITPLHVSMITSAVANAGKMMQPYVLDYTLNYDDNIKNKTIPTMLSQVMSPKEALELTDMMWNVVSYGTGRSAILDGVEIAGKTGTAQNASENDHGLFTAFAPSDNPKIVVTVVLEEAGGGGSTKATKMARDIFAYYLGNF